MVCLGEPRDDDKLLCADGETADIWSGCFDRGSVRIQCPRGTYPCNNLRIASNYTEFQCYSNCKNFGGYKECSSGKS